MSHRASVRTDFYHSIDCREACGFDSYLPIKWVRVRMNKPEQATIYVLKGCTVYIMTAWQGNALYVTVPFVGVGVGCTHQSLLDSPHNGPWHRILMFCLMLNQTTSWTNSCLCLYELSSVYRYCFCFDQLRSEPFISTNNHRCMYFCMYFFTWCRYYHLFSFCLLPLEYTCVVESIWSILNTNLILSDRICTCLHVGPYVNGILS